MACCRCGSRRLRSRTAEAVRAVRGQRAGSTRAAPAPKNGECAAMCQTAFPGALIGRGGGHRPQRAASASKNGECAAMCQTAFPGVLVGREGGHRPQRAASASKNGECAANVPDCIPRCFDRERGRPSATAGGVRFQKRGMRGNVPTAFPGVFYKEATVSAPAALFGQSSPRRMRAARAATRPAHSRSCCPAPSLPQANSRISRPSSTQSSS